MFRLRRTASFKWALFLIALLTSKITQANNYLPAANVDGDSILNRCQNALEEAETIKERLIEFTDNDNGNGALKLYNEILIVLGNALNEASLLAQVHPEQQIRTDAEICEAEGSKFLTDLSLDESVYQAILVTDRTSLDSLGIRMLEHSLRDFRHTGVDQNDSIRAEIKNIKEKLVNISQQFGQNISNDVFYIELDSAEDLAGLPIDYIENHRQASGKYLINTTYPDYVPFMKYAKNDQARRQLRHKYLNRGQNNGPVLDAMITNRQRLANLLGYGSYAQYIVEDKMIKMAPAIHAFIEKISLIAQSGADREYNELLNFKKDFDPQATRIEGHESSFLQEAYVKNKFGLDSQQLRNYFPYAKVRDGLLAITSDLFNITYVKVGDAQLWHDTVDVYDVFDQSGKLGRIYLDMHPREGKYSHAAQFTIRNGILDRQYPEGVLVCNFPGPSENDNYALMEHGDVVTFFHEFGHLMHHTFGGRQQWASFSGVATEWDFVEAPSQLLEEWAWSPDVLARFARHFLTDEAIPADLVHKMRAAEEFGKAISVRQQLFYAALSVNYYDLDADTFDPTELMKDLQQKYSYFPYEEGTHFNYSFGHLDGYSAMYYTYMWSLGLAKDLFEPFKTHGLLNKDTAARYRELVLNPGGSQDAEHLIENFLGRPFSFDAFEKWLTADQSETSY
jgi:thimet oligopeptidase